MKIYLVGGAVRDELLRIPHQEKDWVVVGATVEEMLALKFRPVGKDFPVFLHPETHEEYALARTERKVGRGYKGFVFNASPEVTLDEDLMRRDLTINAIAKTDQGVLVDPFHGQEDIKNKILRHVSPAFVEDPVRILRVGRFAARYEKLGFKVADETLDLMKQMVKSGEVNALVAERVWKEWERALSEKNPERFFEVLDECGAKAILFSSLNLDISMLKKSALKTEDTQVRFAVLLHSLAENEIHALCSDYRVPADYRDLALLVARFKDKYLEVSQLDAETQLNVLLSADAFRREERFNKFMLACKVIGDKDISEQWNKILSAAKEANLDYKAMESLSGKEIGEKTMAARLAAIAKIKSDDP